MDWVIWLVVSLTAFVCLFAAFAKVSSDPETCKVASTMVYGWFGGLATVLVTTVGMEFVVKPALTFILELF